LAGSFSPPFRRPLATASRTACSISRCAVTLNYAGLIAPIVKAIQALSARLTSLEQTVAGFADHFTTKELTFTRATGEEIDVQKLCVGSTCVTPAQFQAMVAAAGASGNAPAPSSTTVSSTATSSDVQMFDTPPVIKINGSNPAHIYVGETICESSGRWRRCMRKVEIVEDPRSQRCWVAMDAKLGEPVMRMHDRELLRRICEGLEWKIVQTAVAGRRSELSR
jgi:hypothetical protein